MTRSKINTLTQVEVREFAYHVEIWCSNRGAGFTPRQARILGNFLLSWANKKRKKKND